MIGSFFIELYYKRKLKEMDAEVSSFRKDIIEMSLIEVEQVPYGEQQVFLAWDAVEHKFLGQGNSEAEMLENIFARYPNKQRLIYGYRDSDIKVKTITRTELAITN